MCKCASMMVIKMLIVILMIIMLDKGWWRRYPCITSGPKKPLLKSEKVPQVKSGPQHFSYANWIVGIISLPNLFPLQLEKGWRWPVLCGHWYPGELVIQNEPWLTVWTPAVILWKFPHKLSHFWEYLWSNGLWSNVQGGLSVRHHRDQIQLDCGSRRKYITLVFCAIGDFWHNLLPQLAIQLKLVHTWYVSYIKWYISTSILLWSLTACAVLRGLAVEKYWKNLPWSSWIILDSFYIFPHSP